MKLFKFVYEWTFKRLPRGFSIPMLTVAVLYFSLAFPWLVYRGTPGVTRFVADQFCIAPIPWEWLHGEEIVSAIISIGFALLGGLVSYGLAGLAYRLWRPMPMKSVTIHSPVLPALTSDHDMGDENALRHYNKIGIILAGGGAKGAYQAGSMRAIYEFLEKHKAHHKVRMIAGTSIGSWNALFWLAGLIKGPNGGKGLHEQWWNHVNVQSVIRPALYVPLRQNHFLSNQPWEETFDAFFVKNGHARDRLLHHIRHPGASDAMHFYFTRSNVERAHLEFTTNRTDLSDIPPNLPSGRRPRPPVPRETWRPAESVEDIRTAVFSSMDLPPLFEYMRIGDKYFEDGGVVDNLPIRFGTEIENCDLLFILPLNASFEHEVDLRSVVKRLFRVMDVRQGVLERNSFKMIYLYNELAALRKQREKAGEYEELLRKFSGQFQELGEQVREHGGPLEQAIEDVLPPKQVGQAETGKVVGPQTQVETAAVRARRRRHDPVQVFSVCPKPELLVGTAEFWKTKEAGRAFRLMYEYTWAELEKFDFRATPDWIRMALVGRHGEITYLEDF
jgi:NTE family protein